MAATVQLPTLTSPNPQNYYVGRGLVFWQPDGGGWRDLGNCPMFQFKPAIKNLDHFSSRLGLKRKDRSIAIEANATIIVNLDEWTADNLALMLMGTEGGTTTDILINTQIIGGFYFTGTNDVGAKMTVLLPRVNLTPTGAIDFIGTKDEFGVLELTGDVLSDVDTGSFGTFTWHDTAPATTPP